jgi:hypothetical protein
MRMGSNMILSLGRVAAKSRVSDGSKHSPVEVLHVKSLTAKLGVHGEVIADGKLFVVMESRLEPA